MTQAIGAVQQQNDNLFQANQAGAAVNNKAQNADAANNGANNAGDTIVAAALKTEKTLNNGLINALKVSLAGINNNANQNAAKAANGANNANNNDRYNNQAKFPNAAAATGNFVNKII
ncbi:MAG: hypothetical protein EVJ46_01220 [Candidatus Acididesulfobacter guangdongensis]|uniref:Uncharacterized protein n=1 Tax=Acididesulfobacter guangdongensis TaxID=2597225 RepID=A0A519BHY7_ACIG2|nr:MAG: hypothetical protein EVJ46_01220 [Candidatus Acididesulfobacter guangdongensis]